MQRKRNALKAKLHSEADRLQGLLLSSLAKEKAIQQALGSELASQLTSPKKRAKLSDTEKEDIYKLPPIPEQSVGDAMESSNSSPDEKSYRHYYNINLNSIDVNSKKFLDLPPDVRHDILTDLKEKRKESSWGRLHELPVQSEDFSEFQMKRLLKRRQVQVSLESAEKEMGGKCLSLAEVEAMLTDEGVLSAASSSAAKSIASNENALYLHVKSLQDAAKEEKRRTEEEETEKLAKKQQQTPSMEEQIQILDSDEDEDMQAAIRLSLLDTIPPAEQTKDVKLRPEQKKFLKNAAKDSAKDYMIEYGGFNADEVKELVMSDDDDEAESTFLHNDTFILKGDATPETENRPCDSPLDANNSNSEVSSEADSDFIEVPEVEELPCTPLEMNREPDADLSKDFRHEDLGKPNGLHIQIEKTEVLEDDLFADIFKREPSVTDETKAEIISIGSDECELVGENGRVTQQVKPPVELTNILENLQSEISDITSLNLDSLPLIKTSNPATVSNVAECTSSAKNLGSILDELNSEMTDILEKGIDAIKHRELSTPEKSAKTPESVIFKTPTKSTQQDQYPPKVVSPFFRKKTPSPQKRKASVAGDPDGVSPKMAKTLFPGPSSDVEPLELAAAVLRENKTTEELSTMAADIRDEKRELEYERNKQDRFGMNITERMSSDCKRLLKLFGVPYIDAPMEAESQCAFLNQVHLTDGTITDDSDIWLFGGRTVRK